MRDTLSGFPSTIFVKGLRILSDTMAHSVCIGLVSRLYTAMQGVS